MIVDVSWSEFKNLISNTGLGWIYIDEEGTNGNYSVYMSHNGFIFKSYLRSGNADHTEFENDYKAQGNKNLVSKTAVSGVPKVAIVNPEAGDGESSYSLASHNFCDKTTWYTNSVQVTGETATLDTGKTYDVANDYIIDVTHGKLAKEDPKLSSYAIKVYDNGTELTEHNPIMNVTGDYTVDHANGKITFEAGYTVTGPVTVDYWYATDSEFIIKPPAGKIIKIDHSEIQFSTDINMKPVYFEYWGNHPVYGFIKGDYDLYKNLDNIIDIARRGTGQIAATDTMQNPRSVFPFEYERKEVLRSTALTGVWTSMEIRIKTLDDQVMGGERGTITIYVTEEDE